MEVSETNQNDILPEDSGTESYTDSPINEDDSEHSEDSTICNYEGPGIGSKSRQTKFQHILDKSFSVDEEMLVAPLMPLQYTSSTDNENNESGIDLTLPSNSTDRYISSILRRGSCFESRSNTSLDSFQSSLALRRVSFPNHIADLASYQYPESENSWEIDIHTPEEILSIYENSCKTHHAIEFDMIKSQISEIRNNINHSAVLNLSSINVTRDVNETLEDLLKVTNFRTIILTECKFSTDTITEFLNMLEYYESTREIEVAMEFKNSETWKSFCSACSNIMVLQSISFKSMEINADHMRNFLHAVKNNPHITTLKFDCCILEKLPSFYLVDCLMSNTTVRELYLPSTGLYTKEADCLGRFLQNNFYLEILDISNNFIGDRGLEVLAKGLQHQTVPGCGLSVLVVFNNQLTEKSGSIIANLIAKCKNLTTLNIGYNNLTDEALVDMKDALSQTTSLEGLGLQCTLLTCKGIDSLAGSIESNTSLLKINLKGNKAIQVTGVERLSQALTNSKITKIEIDDTNRSCSDPIAYLQLVKKLNAICTVNKSFMETKEDDEVTNVSQLISRKVSLSCEPRFHIPPETVNSVMSLNAKNIAPTPIPSPISSPAAKSRFHITRVPDNSPRPCSRFKVTRVMPSPDEDEESGRFVNVRSSVSSNDSVDSLVAHPDL